MRLFTKINRLTHYGSHAGRDIDLGRDPVLSSLIRLALPAMAMMLFQSLFQLVDTVFISWLGERYMTAISFTFPVQIATFAILGGVGSGMTSLVGRRLGEGNIDEARKIARAGLSLAYTLCILWVPFLFPSFSDMFFRMLGAHDKMILRQAWLYNMWVTPICILISFSFIANSVFKCQGNTMTPLRFFLIANSINLVLDPIFIFVFGWGMTGAAFATFLGRFIGTFYLLKKLRSKTNKLPMGFLPHFGHGTLKRWGQITAIGLPVALSTGSVALGVGSVNRILSAAYGNVAVSSWMIEMRIEDFAFNTTMGINDALIPFLAYNFGMRSKERMLRGLRSAMFINCAITGTFCLILFIFPMPFIELFRPSPETARITAMSLRLSILGYPALIYNVTGDALFVATGHSGYSLTTQFLRSLVVRIPAARLLARLTSVMMVWWFQPICFFSASITTFFFKKRLVERLENDMKKG